MKKLESGSLPLKGRSEEKELEAEELTRELARRELGLFIKYHFETYRENWHHTLILKKLEAVERGEIRKLMIFVPPRHGKTEIASINFPAWFFGRNPKKSIIAASYNSDLAISFGRKARNIVDSREYQNLFPVSLAEDSKAAGQWNTNQGGEYTAVGIGSGVTGRGADVFLIDDPVKDKQEAESVVIQERNIGWYRSVARTRLSPLGAIVLIQCMTGDTQVLMADASNKELKNIRPGDSVATYEKGKLTTSTVKNWANQGSDLCFTIRMKSGILVRANERHPFLVSRNNSTEWTKLKNLKIGDEILRVHGVESSAHLTDAISQQKREDSVLPTTTKQNGLVDIEHPLSTQNHTGEHILSTDTELHSKSTENFSQNKKTDAQYAENFQERTSEHTGEENSASITTTQPTGSEDYSVMTATSQLDMEKQKTFSLKPLSTYEILQDEIVEISESGYEDVFDIQVERTENFIANGLISHNTRWHDLDLAGQILATEHDWDIVDLSAIAERDEENRRVGEALWADQYPLTELLAIKKELGTELWSALYQQKPISEESQIFKRHLFKYRNAEELEHLMTRCFVTIDPAPGKSESSDFIGVCVNWVDPQNFWNIKAYRIKFDAAQLINLLFKLHQDTHFEVVGIEKGMYNDVLKPFLDAEMLKRNVFFSVKELDHGQRSKELRIRGLTPRYEAGQIYHLKGYCEDLESELLRFPKASHDDVSDAVAYQLQLADAPMGTEPMLAIRENQLERQSGRADAGL